MSGVFSKLSKRFKANSPSINQAQDKVAFQNSNPSSQDFRGSRDYARLVESVKSIEDEFHAAMHRTQDPVILSALTQSLLIIQSQVKPLLDSTASDDDRAALSDLYDSVTQVIHDTREPINKHEDRISSAHYKTTVNENLHETKTVRDYDELLFALEDLSRRIDPGDKAEVLAASKNADGKTYVDEMSIDWGDSGDGKISLVFGPTALLPIPNDGASNPTQHDSTDLALRQPDELGESVSEEDLRGFDVEQVIEVIEAIRHDDVKRMARFKRETPEVYRIASIADGYMVSWYDDEEDRPSMKEAVLKAIRDDSAGVRGPSREFLEAMQTKLGDGGLR